MEQIESIAKESLENTSGEDKTIIDKNVDLDSLSEKQLEKVIANGTYGILTVPKLDLEVAVTKGITTNILRYYVGMYTTSDEPGTIEGNTALAAHSVIPNSGSCAYCYFNNIGLLGMGDDIYLQWVDGKTYHYQVSDKFDRQEKNSTFAYTTEEDKSLLTLVTCSNGDNRYRTYVLAELIETSES